MYALYIYMYIYIYLPVSIFSNENLYQLCSKNLSEVFSDITDQTL